MAAQALVQAGAKVWTPWREYSRGNDDPNEAIFETALVKVELPIDQAASKISLKYTATESTVSMLRWIHPAGEMYPIMDNVTEVVPVPAGATPEFEIFRPFLFLQTVAGTVNTVVPAGAAGVNLGYAGGALSAQIDVGTWPAGAGTISGTAVIQMRIRQYFEAGAWHDMFTDPAFMPPAGVTTRLVYWHVRENIAWSVKFEAVAGAVKPKEFTLEVKEMPFFVVGTVGQIATDLRIVDSSYGLHPVFKVGYPAFPGVARKDADPNVDGAQDDPTIPGDQRAEPETPIPDWGTQILAKDK